MFALALASITLAQPQVWTLGVGGDLMLNGIASKTNPFAKVVPYTSACDVFIANLEIPLTNKTTATTRKSAEAVKAKTQFILKADPAHGVNLSKTGIDLVSLGNNHSMDYGPDGLSQMLDILDKWKIGYAGAGADRASARAATVFSSKQTPKLSLTSYLAFMSDKALNTCWPATDNTAGLAALRLGGVVNKTTLPTIKAIVQRAKQSGDFVVIALHWGIEKQTLPTPYQVSLGRAFIDAGADIVLGHHPHVLQGAEVYKGQPIFYSLGNFISPRPGVTGIFKLTFEDSKIKAMSILPCSISGGTVAPYTDVRVLKAQSDAFGKLCDLIQTKFPNKQSKKPSIALWKNRS